MAALHQFSSITQIQQHYINMAALHQFSSMKIFKQHAQIEPA
jgi:hypothetical protein